MSCVPTGLDEETLQHIGQTASSVPLEDFRIHAGEFTYPLFAKTVVAMPKVHKIHRIEHFGSGLKLRSAYLPALPNHDSFRGLIPPKNNQKTLDFTMRR